MTLAKVPIALRTPLHVGAIRIGHVGGLKLLLGGTLASLTGLLGLNKLLRQGEVASLHAALGIDSLLGWLVLEERLDQGQSACLHLVPVILGEWHASVHELNLLEG
jgi:hypothetical protein